MLKRHNRQNFVSKDTMIHYNTADNCVPSMKVDQVIPSVDGKRFSVAQDRNVVLFLAQSVVAIFLLRLRDFFRWHRLLVFLFSSFSSTQILNLSILKTN